MPLFKIAFRKYPKFIDALERRHEVYNETLEHIRQKEKQGDLIVIRPEKALPIGKIEHNADKMRAVHTIGYQTGLKYAEKVKEFLKK